MEFSRNEVLDLPGRRGVDVCQTINLRVQDRAIRVGTCCGCLADAKCECKHELVVVAELQYEGGRARGRDLRILGAHKQSVSKRFQGRRSQ